MPVYAPAEAVATQPAEKVAAQPLAHGDVKDASYRSAIDQRAQLSRYSGASGAGGAT